MSGAAFYARAVAAHFVVFSGAAFVGKKAMPFEPLQVAIVALLAICWPAVDLLIYVRGGMRLALLAELGWLIVSTKLIELHVWWIRRRIRRSEREP